MKDFVRIHKRAILLGLAALLVVAASIGGTLAWLTSTPSGLINTFVPGNVPNEIHEDFDDGDATKSNVMIKNVGNVNAFIRVVLVPIWRNTSDNSGAGIAADMSQLTISPALPTGSTPVNKWVYADGYYYYTEPVAPGAFTEELIGSATVNVVKDGKYLELQILSQSVQAEGMGQTIDTAQEAFQIAFNASAGSPGA